ncbi:Cytochrome c assembly protein [uncultured delta proteobacterium]|uniref:Cytochrome c assembly protein n=1 Tax=uncultured delta proteobacterium TaxID=34034 RepID=A0A212J9W4_9DELT|nr:Cytochrome c assembly protein [uncultured delta proteobacterium]
MPLVGFLLLLSCFLLSLAAAALAVPRLTRGQAAFTPPRLMEAASLLIFALLTTACFILTAALASSNFSFLYAVMNSDRALHLFYRLTALWGGQEGALLFWAWCAALFTVAFQRTKSYRLLPAETQRWFWAVYCTIMGFFCLLLTAWNNPFLASMPVPADGYGLNPLLQNPGMIFHPPLLFLGYGAFTVPCCLALAALLSLRENTKKKHAEKPLAWAALTRPFILLAWLFLGAGIILGGWWSYMELGWGGYWAWDPVENSSLVPWLLATAYLHTALVENARGKLYRTNAFLMAMVTVSAFFSTYLVRGGIVRSVHAFGQSDVGVPLLAFTVLFFLFSLFAAYGAPQKSEALESPLTREGLLTCTAWIFLGMALIITVGTLWPVFSRIWSEKPVGLSVGFYNTTCLPLFTLLILLLAVCPWVGWNGKIRHKALFAFTGLIACATCASLLVAGFSKPLALVASAAAMAVMAGACLHVSAQPGIWRFKPMLAAHGTHFGLALIVLGIAFSGPYKMQRDFVLKPGQNAAFGDYTLHLVTVGGGDSHSLEAGNAPHPDHATAPPKFIYSEAVVAVSRNGESVGTLKPQLRRYASHPDSTFSEVDTIFGWGNELYCSMLGVDEKGTATVQVSVNPLVNWIWIGGILLCVLPLFGLGRRGSIPGETPDTTTDATA